MANELHISKQNRKTNMIFDPFKNYRARQKAEQEIERQLFGPHNKPSQPTNNGDTMFDQELIDDFDSLFGTTENPPVAEATPDILETAKRGKVSEFLALKAAGVEYDLDRCLDYAAYGDNVEMIRHLVLVEKAVPTYDHCFATLDRYAYDALDELLSLGADPHAQNDALTYHAAAINYSALEILAKHGAKNYTPILKDFIEDDMTEVAIYLMNNGAEPDLETLSRASHIKDLTILKYLLTDKGMVPPEQRFMDELSDRFSEAKQLLNKAFLQAKLKTKYKPTTQQQGMKI